MIQIAFYAFMLINSTQISRLTNAPVFVKLKPITKVLDSIPELNKSILDFVKLKINKKVGRGECWDLAAEALNAVNAKWDHQMKFGKLLNSKTDSIYAGDIIQFEDVLLKYTKDGKNYNEHMDHHTAIIFETIGPGNYRIAHQNNEYSGRKVGISPLYLSTKVRGKIKIYRPVN
ncbi:MAG: hypothetical protein IPO78_00370 [Saprospiraceae bacterium]|nr:hypothetical protein [Saprospiraceae bacterium]